MCTNTYKIYSLRQIHVPFFFLNQNEKTSMKDFSIHINSSRKRELRLFIAIMYPMTMAAPMLQWRNVSVADYRVLPWTLLGLLLTLKFIRFNMLLKMGEVLNSKLHLTPFLLDTDCLISFILSTNAKKWGLDKLINQIMNMKNVPYEIPRIIISTIIPY